MSCHQYKADISACQEVKPSDPSKKSHGAESQQANGKSVRHKPWQKRSAVVFRQWIKGDSFKEHTSSFRQESSKYQSV